jgi:hypothetical protein
MELPSTVKTRLQIISYMDEQGISKDDPDNYYQTFIGLQNQLKTRHKRFNSAVIVPGKGLSEQILCKNGKDNIKFRDYVSGQKFTTERGVHFTFQNKPVSHSTALKYGWKFHNSFRMPSNFNRVEHIDPYLKGLGINRDIHGQTYFDCFQRLNNDFKGPHVPGLE